MASTPQMIPTSRKRGYRAETIIETAVVNTNIGSRITGSSSQVQTGETPSTRMNTKLTIRFRPRLNSVVQTTASGYHQPRELGLADHRLVAHDRGTAIVVASWKKPNRTTLNSRNAG